ncbi:hypothetical protein HELRODRAFT_190056 [Helobdella robusta]|uniref:Uncharacterized protein n=1 Tax=Helobdella robusta TaxID=6412 RepID=T1FRM6_HELRO|nr:hypothetical protein HELRODRAFT_190056 [Helobdella robusta]ESO11724.1 hypothetical protein HELRODRAFT_190056 [Helobdella robusta]
MFNSGGLNLKGVNETDKVLLKSCMLNTIPSRKMSLGGVYHSILSKHSNKVCSSMFQDSTFRMQKKHLRFSVSSPSKSWEKNIEAWNIKENTFLSQKLIQRLDDNDDSLDKDDAITSRHIETYCNEIVDTSRTNMDVDKIVIASESNTDSSLASTQADKIIKSEENNTSVDEIDRSLTTSNDTSVSNNSSLFLTDTKNYKSPYHEASFTNRSPVTSSSDWPVSFIGSHDDCNLQRSESGGSLQDLPRADLSQLVRPPLRRVKNNDSPRASKLTPRRSSRRSTALTELKHNLLTTEPVSSMSTSSSYHIDTLLDTSIQKSSSHIKNENYKEENEASTSSSQKINDNNLNDDVYCQICFSCAAREETVETNDRHDPGVVEFKSFIQDINFRTPVKRPKGDHDVGRQSSRKSVSKLKKHMNRDDGDGSGEKKLQQAEECHEPVKKSLKMDEYSIEPNERLTPAQRLIRSKRLNKKINSEDNKPLNDQHVKMLPNVSDHFSMADIKNADTTFKFSNPSVKHTKRKSETRSGSMKFVFSPPLTRARQKKQIDDHDETKNKR